MKIQRIGGVTIAALVLVLTTHFATAGSTVESEIESLEISTLSALENSLRMPDEHPTITRNRAKIVLLQNKITAKLGRIQAWQSSITAKSARLLALAGASWGAKSLTRQLQILQQQQELSADIDGIKASITEANLDIQMAQDDIKSLNDEIKSIQAEQKSVPAKK